MEVLIKYHIVESLEDIKAIGHRMVHGGEYYDHSVPESKEAEDKIDELKVLAPLHNPAGLLGYRSFKKLCRNVSIPLSLIQPFHQSMPEENYIYPIPL